MKITTLRRAVLCAPLFAVLLINPAEAQKRKGGQAIKQAEAILGKPLTDAQKKAVKAANAQRQKEIKPIQEKYRIAVAKVLGISVAEYEAREKKVRQKKDN